MRSLFLNELYKLWRQRTFILITLFVILIFFVQALASSHSTCLLDPQLYETKKEAYAVMPEDVSLQKLEHEIAALQLIHEYRHAKEGGMSDNEYLRIFGVVLEENGFSLPLLFREYGEYFNYTEDEYAALSSVLTRLKEQYQYIASYQVFLDEMPARAEEALHLPAFSDENGFPYRNIQKSLRDYERLHGISICPDLDEGLSILLKASRFFPLFAILILIAVTLLLSEEKASGMREILSGTKRGRLPLGLSKYAALVFYTVAVVALTYSGCILIAGKMIGFGDIGRSIQSVPLFRDCPYPISVRQFLMLSVLFPVLAALTLLNLAVLLSVLCRNTRVSVLFYLLFTSALYLLSYVFPLPVASGLPGEINPFSFADTGSLFSTYKNIDLFSYPQPEIAACFAAGLSFSILSLSFCFLVTASVIRLPEKPASDKRRASVRGSTLLFVNEAARLLFFSFGILLLVGLLVFALLKLSKKPSTLNEEEYFYYYYGKAVSGPVNSEMLAYFEEESAALDQKATSQNGFFSDPSLKKKQDALAKVRADYFLLLSAHERGLPVSYIPPLRTDPVYAKSNGFLIASLLVMLLQAFFLVPMFAADTDSGMEQLVRSAKKGRVPLFWTRYLLIMLYDSCCFLLLIFPVLFSWFRYSGIFLSELNAPVESILRFVHADQNISIRIFTLLYAAGFYLSSLSFCSLITLLSAVIKRRGTTLVSGLLLILADHMLSLTKTPGLMQLSLSSGAALPDILENSGSFIVCCLVLIKNLLIFFLLILLHYRCYAGPSRKKHKESREVHHARS